MEAATPDQPGNSRDEKSITKPSLGESLLNGMRGLHLDDDKPSVTFASNVNVAKPPNTSMRDQEVTASPSMASSGTPRPLSSGQLPKPRDSMVKSLSRRRDPPVVRQTKTSSIRLGRSLGKRTWGSTGKSKEEVGHTTFRERQDSVSPTLEHNGIHLRAQSRGRYGVTLRGSPYTVASRSQPRQRQPSGTERRTSPSRSPSGGDNSIMDVTSESTEELSITMATDQVRRKSSIPLPARLTQQSNKVEEQHQITSTRDSTNNFPAALEADEFDRQKYSPESSPVLPQQPRAELAGSEVPASHAAIAKDQSGKLTAKEMLSSPLPEDLSAIDTDSSCASTRGYDEHGGFRVKKIRTTTKDGPILRITDSASHILLGDDQVSAPTDGHGSVYDESGSQELEISKSASESSEMSSYLVPKPASLAHDIGKTSLMIIKSDDDEETQQLITDSGWQRNTSDSRFSTTSSSGTIKKTPEHGNHDDEEAGHDKNTENNRASAERRSNDACYQSDWPGKDFAQFKQPSATFPALPDEPSSAPQAKEFVEIGQHSMTASSTSRPSTIVVQAAPSREISPFLYQDSIDGQLDRQQYLNDYVSHAAASSADRETQKKVNFPPRSSSRKPKPPPIIVSPPEGFKSKSLTIKAAERAHAVPAESLGQPKNVKTFSQSISPGSANKPRPDGKLQHSPSSSKKVMSNIRGLFHKRSLDSAADRTGLSLRRVPSTLDSRNHVPGNGYRNFIMTNMQRSQTNSNATVVGKLAIPPSYDTNQSNIHKSTLPKLRNPFASPITPFTAGMTTHVGSPGSSPTMPQPLGSPSNHNSLATPTLHTATSLTHHLLSMARVEPVLSRKEQMIDLSKAMVEVIGAARDAEKAVEQAKMEAAKAEMAYLKVLGAVSRIEAVVRDTMTGLGPQEGAANRQ